MDNWWKWYGLWGYFSCVVFKFIQCEVDWNEVKENRHAQEGIKYFLDCFYRGAKYVEYILNGFQSCIAFGKNDAHMLRMQPNITIILKILQITFEKP